MMKDSMNDIVTEDRLLASFRDLNDHGKAVLLAQTQDILADQIMDEIRQLSSFDTSSVKRLRVYLSGEEYTLFEELAERAGYSPSDAFAAVVFRKGLAALDTEQDI